MRSFGWALCRVYIAQVSHLGQNPNVCLLDTAKHVKFVRVLYVSGTVLTLAKCVLVQMNVGKLVYQVVRAIANSGLAFPHQLNWNYFLMISR